jgi:hypothetical protein
MTSNLDPKNEFDPKIRLLPRPRLTGVSIGGKVDRLEYPTGVVLPQIPWPAAPQKSGQRVRETERAGGAVGTILKADAKAHWRGFKHRKEIASTMNKLLGTYGPSGAAIGVLLGLVGKLTHAVSTGNYEEINGVQIYDEAMAAFIALGFWGTRPNKVSSEKAGAK